jgi:hypothetical protein
MRFVSCLGRWILGQACLEFANEVPYFMRGQIKGIAVRANGDDADG